MIRPRRTDIKHFTQIIENQAKFQEGARSSRRHQTHTDITTRKSMGAFESKRGSLQSNSHSPIKMGRGSVNCNLGPPKPLLKKVPSVLRWKSRNEIEKKSIFNEESMLEVYPF